VRVSAVRAVSNNGSRNIHLLLVLRKCPAASDSPFSLYANWELGAKARLAAVLYNLAESIRIVSILIQPFMPETPERYGISWV